MQSHTRKWNSFVDPQCKTLQFHNKGSKVSNYYFFQGSKIIICLSAVTLNGPKYDIIHVQNAYKEVDGVDGSVRLEPTPAVIGQEAGYKPQDKPPPCTLNLIPRHN